MSLHPTPKYPPGETQHLYEISNHSLSFITPPTEIYTGIHLISGDFSSRVHLCDVTYRAPPIDSVRSFHHTIVYRSERTEDLQSCHRDFNSCLKLGDLRKHGNHLSTILYPL
ncbi:hypothetical protein GDO81_002955 [Engystomops pustulosus]|uniref:Uncharacterized protein n=1 Tax=Engystomops pustulosus TaxID=76066 RepID=A0AAV7DQJ9_ENGPU|nr:hypothetical protein GDO81_002955 [Engystomops pustulosus]